MEYDITVIGGGVVGTAIFNKLVRLGKKVCLIEKQNDVGFGSSKANSALIHAGFDCKPNTLKAKLNLRGNAMWKDLATRLGVPFVQRGHLVVGEDRQKLVELLERGKQNGVPKLKIIEAEALCKMEPNLKQKNACALFAGTGGEVSSYDLPIALAEEAIINGGTVLLEFDTKKIIKKAGKFEIVAQDGRKVESTYVVNSCGAGYNDIARLLGAETYDIKFRRGEYYLLDKKVAGYVNHTIFPLPTKDSKGILVTETVHGNLMVGPTSIPSGEEPITSTLGLAEIKTQTEERYNGLPFNQTIRVFSGVRNIVGEDFVIEKSAKVPNVINLAGICSPGLTSAPAIAEMVATLLGLDPQAEVRGLKRRKGYTNLSAMSNAERAEFVQKHPSYGKIVCRCEGVSLGQIAEAVNSPLPARSVDGIKRRVRAGMGRCQGGFCLFGVMETLAKSAKTNFGDQCKDGKNSIICHESIKPQGGK